MKGEKENEGGGHFVLWPLHTCTPSLSPPRAAPTSPDLCPAHPARGRRPSPAPPPHPAPHPARSTPRVSGGTPSARASSILSPPKTRTPTACCQL